MTKPQRPRALTAAEKLQQRLEQAAHLKAMLAQLDACTHGSDVERLAAHERLSALPTQRIRTWKQTPDKE